MFLHRVAAVASKRAAFAAMSTTATAAAAPALSAATTAPSVRDVMIQLNFVDPSGARRKVPGLIGAFLFRIICVYELD